MEEMKKGDLAFFYHSNCKPPGIVGIMEIVQEHSIDRKRLVPLFLLPFKPLHSCALILTSPLVLLLLYFYITAKAPPLAFLGNLKKQRISQRPSPSILRRPKSKDKKLARGARRVSSQIQVHDRFEAAAGSCRWGEAVSWYAGSEAEEVER